MDKTVLITGTGRENGIGYTTALKLADLGYHIIPTARKKEDVEELSAGFSEKGIEATVLELDITQAKSISAVVETIKKKFGFLDCLINNAAINLEGAAGEDSNLPSQTPLEHFRKTLEVNLLGTIAVTQALLPLLRESSAGRIVNVTSNLASLTLHSDPNSPIYDMKLPSYDISKVAINLWTIELAWELEGTPIKVNSAHPGWVQTDMGGKNAPLNLSEGAETLVELATLPPSGPTGGFFHQGEKLPW